MTSSANPVPAGAVATRQPRPAADYRANPEYSPIVITPDEGAEVRVVAEVVAVLP